MGMLEILSLLSCKDGDELFEKVKDILFDFNICVYGEDGLVKDVRELCWDVAEVLKNNTK